MQNDDYQWFLEQYDRLFNEYGDAYLAIKDKTIIGVYSSYAEGVKETAKRYPLGSFIVQYCNGSPSAYTSYISALGIAF